MSTSYKILVVDDEPDVQPLVLQRMRRSIRSGKYQFVFAQDGVEALETLESDPDIDMVLSDINMPRMDGLTLLDQIPKANPNVRSVIISAYGDMENIRTAMNRGAFDFVTKPIDFKDLQVTMERTLRNLEEWRAALASRDQLVALQNELDVATNMQQSILPTDFPSKDTYQVFASMEAARNVGGDFFDVMTLDDEHVGIAIADVSGKGVPAALFMMSSRTLLKGASIGHELPGDVLQEVNDLLEEDNEAMMFVTVLYATYNPRNGTLVYSSGGHDPPLIVHPDGSSTLLPLTGGIALGMIHGLEYTHQEYTLSPGDTVVLYTDGVSEAMNEEHEEYGIDRLREMFASNPPSDAEEANRLVLDSVREFVGEAPQSDDITCLALHHSENAQ